MATKTKPFVGGRSLTTLAMLLAMPTGVALGAPADEAQVAGGLEEVMVTARKRSESTQDVPVSVTAMGEAELARFDLASLERIASMSPQFVIGRAPSGSGATLVLRGIGSNTTSIGLEQSVAVVVDGVYYGQGRVINEGFFDVGRVELLKGPQALFYGKNATAGVVAISTADPGDEAEMKVKLGFEFEGEQRFAEVVGSLPLSDTLSLRVALRGSEQSKGYFRNAGTVVNYPSTNLPTGVLTQHPSQVGASGAVDDRYARVTLKWKPSDQLTATLKVNAGEQVSDNPGATSVYFNCPTGAAAGNAAIPCVRDFVSSSNAFPADIAATLPYANEDGKLGNDYRSYAVTGNIEYAGDGYTISSVSNFNHNRNIFRYDDDSLSAAGPRGVNATEWSSFDAFSTEFRVLTTSDGPLNGMLGAYYQSTKRDYLAFTASGGLENTNAPQPYQRYLANSKDSETEGKTFAVFAQGIWSITPQVEAAAGLRYTRETKDSYFLQPYSHPTRVAQGVFLPGVTITADQKFTNVSPEATLTWRPSDDITVYGAYKTAYKSGGFSNSGILSPTAGVEDFAFDPEKAKGFEGGIKATLADRQLRLNLGVYRYRFTNLQIDFFNSPVFAFSTINAGSATTRGVEIEAEYAPNAAPGLRFSGSLNYNKARYGNVPNAPCYSGQTPALGCTIPAVGARPQQNLQGKPTANAPLWTATLGAGYEAEVGGNLLLGFNVNARYSDEYLPTAFGNANTLQPSYTSIDASLRLSTADERWELALIGKNLTNRFYITGGTDAPNTGARTGLATGLFADQVGYANLPRTVQLQLTWKH